MAEVVIPEIKHEYIRQVDTETTKDGWFDECIADNKEAAWAGIGTSENDSQYQPAPSVEPDYYMQYCSSDDYDYLKDYRLIWGYGIGIIEQDVICSLSTGEHLAEGKDACDTYATENAAGQDTDWKRGTWIKFSGNRNVSPTRIGEVILPERVISLKDLCVALTLTSYTLVEGFNTENIINIDTAFANKYIDATDSKIFDFSNILTAKDTFRNVRFYNNISFSFINVNDIDYYYTFSNATINNIPSGFNTVGGRYCFYNSGLKGELTNINAKLYAHQYDGCKITKINENNNFIAQNNVDYAFANNSFEYFAPNINWNLTTSANYFFNEVSTECKYNIDFTSLSNNIKVINFIYNISTTNNITINIIANNNYRVDFGTNDNSYNFMFRLTNGDKIYIENILHTIYRNKKECFLFTLDGNDVIIVGSFDTIQFANFQAQDDVIINNNSNIILYNDSSIINNNILIYFTSKSRFDIIDFNINNINFDNCSSINFEYDTRISDYTVPFFEDINITIHTTKDDIEIGGLLFCNLIINLKDNTNVKILANKFTYGNTHAYHINKNATLTLINDNNLNDVILETNKRNYDYQGTAGILYYIKTNNNVIVNYADITDIEATILIDNCNQLIINLGDTNFTHYNRVYILNKNCNNIKLNLQHSIDSIPYLYTLTENIQYTLITSCSINGHTYSPFCFIRGLAYAHINVETAKNIPLPNFKDINNNDIEYINQIYNLDNVPYEYLLKSFNGLHRIIKNNYEYIGLTGAITIKSIDCSNKTLELENFVVGDNSNFETTHGDINIYNDETFNCIFNGIPFNDNLTQSYNVYWNNYSIINPIKTNYTIYINEVNNDELIVEILYNNKVTSSTVYLKESCINVVSLIINAHYNFNIHFDDYFNDKLITLLFNIDTDFTVYNDLDLSRLSMLSQESINSIVNPSNYKSGATITIHTTPFQYITEEQKQALVDAGVTLVEYIPTETTE